MKYFRLINLETKVASRRPAIVASNKSWLGEGTIAQSRRDNRNHRVLFPLEA